MKICPKCGRTYEDTVQVCLDDNTQLTHKAPSPSDPMITKELAGRFLITDKIGQGGMGAVYKAVHTQMDRTCAIKLMSPASHDSESAIARFKREAKMASRIDNPHAITIYDFGQAEAGMLYLAMEFIDGRPLSQLLAQERKLTADRVVHITRQIAEALAAAHALGIVHRDLKPDNIMITRKGAENDYVKVLDFGIAKSVTEDNAADNLTKTGFILGTPVYMSPEQLSGEQLDARSDVYSLAIIVYEMLSGRLPFEGDNAQAVMIRRLTSEPIPLRAQNPSVSEAIERTVMAALARNRDLRIPTVEQFAADLSSALYSGTQVMGSRPTANITDQSIYRGTDALSDRQTINETRAGGIDATGGAGHAASPSPSAPAAPSTVPDQDRIVTPPEQPQASPSAYVTRPSGAGFTPGSVNNAQPSGGMLEPTVPLDSPQPAQFNSAPAYAAPTQKQGSKALLVIAAIAIFALLGLGAAGYFLFLRGNQAQNQTAQPASNTPATAPPANAANVNNLEAATEHYNQGKKHQEQAYMLTNAGSRTEADEESKKAIAEYRQALALKPTFPQAHENLAVALYNVGNFDSAVEAYRTAIEQYTAQNQKPTAQVMTNYGLALFDLKRYREAADAFGRALEIDPSDTDLHALHGFALHNSGSVEAAKAAYKQYLSLAPTGDYSDVVRQIIAGRAQPPTETGNR